MTLVSHRLTRPDIAVGDDVPVLVVDITPRTVIMGASASRDWQPQHHDYVWAHEKVGTDVFLNTPNQAGWIERYLTDWAGPTARLAQLTFRMKKTVVPGNALRFAGTVTAVTPRDGVTFVDVEILLTVDETLVTACTTRIAVPDDLNSTNPWELRGDAWRPNDD